MGKLFRIVFLTVFTAAFFSAAVSAMDESYYGGASRLQAMGGQEIVVQDSASMLDLYEQGFEAAIFTRPAKSVIFLYPEFDMFLSKHVNETNNTTYNVSDFSGGNALYKGVNNGLLFRLSPDTIITIKPYINIGPGSTKITQPGNPEQDNNRMEYDTSGDIELAQNLNNRLSLGGVIGYYRDATLTDMKTTGSPENKDTSYYDKVNYEVSAALLPASAGDWAFALSAGDRAGVMPLYFSESSSYLFNSTFVSDRGIIGSFFSTHDYNKTEDSLTRTEQYVDLATTGYTAGLGAACGTDKDAVFSARVRLLAGVNEKFTSRTVMTDLATNAVSTLNALPYLNVKNGMGADMDFNYRKNMGSYSLGAKLSLFDINYKSEDSSGSGVETAKDLLYYKFSAGADIGGRAFSVPLELFFEHAIEDSKLVDEQVDQFYDFGAKLGTEFGIAGWPVLRAGLDYVMGGQRTGTKVNGKYTVESPMPGALNNPWISQLGINCGAGFTSDSMELNLNLRYVPYWLNPANTYISYSAGALKVMADIKFYL